MAKNLLQNNCDLVSTTPTGSALGSSQGLVLVQEVITGNTSFVNFTGLANYPYNNYKLIITNGGTNEVIGVSIYLSTNNGTSFLSTSGYSSINNYLTYNSGTLNNSNSAQSQFLLNIGVSINGSKPTFDIEVDLLNMNSTTKLVCCVGSGTFFDGTTTYYGIISGIYGSIINANAIQINPGSGTTFGNFYLYGYNQ